MMTVLLWLRARGFVFWFSATLGLLSAGVLGSVLLYVGESQEVISFQFLRAKPDVTLTMSADAADAKPNSTLTYTMRVTNHGPGRAKRIEIDVTMPQGVEFVSAIPAGPACFEASGVVNCRLGALEATESVEASVTVRVGDSARSPLVASAVVKTSLVEADESNNAATLETPLR